MTEKEMERQLDLYCKELDGEDCENCKLYDKEEEICLNTKDNIKKNYDLLFAPCTRGSILDAAKQCVTADRESQYGSPEDNFKQIAELWAVYLKGRCVSEDADICILPEDVAVMMALLKIARIKTGTFKEDSFVDACGYLACAAELAKR